MNERYFQEFLENNKIDESKIKNYLSRIRDYELECKFAVHLPENVLNSYKME